MAQVKRVVEIPKIYPGEHVVEPDYTIHEWECYNLANEAASAQCASCAPMGDETCKGTAPYGSLFTTRKDSPCTCVFQFKEPTIDYRIEFTSGEVSTWQTVQYATVPDPPVQGADCSLTVDDFHRYSCEVEADPAYVDAHKEELSAYTKDLFGLNDDPFAATEVDRLRGTIAVEAVGIVSFPTPMSYRIAFEGSYIQDYSESSKLVMVVPDEVFWRNVTIKWTVYTTSAWELGAFSVGEGYVQWYPETVEVYREEISEECIEGMCVGPLGFNCMQRGRPQCMSRRQHLITFVVVFILPLLGAAFGALLIKLYVKKRRGEKIRCLPVPRFPFKKVRCVRRRNGCLPLPALMVLLVCGVASADAWGGCVNPSIVQSSLESRSDNGEVSRYSFTGEMSLANLNGQSCITVEHEHETIANMVFRVKEARFEYPLTYAYSTYKTHHVQVQTDSKCPVVLCSTISCDDICKENDRNCGDRLHIDTAWPGSSQCFEPPTADFCATTWLPGCKRMRSVVGYSLIPGDWFKVYKLGAPSLMVDIEVKVQVNNGTTYTSEYTVDSSSSDLVNPIVSSSGVDFFNNGISNINEATPENYVFVKERADKTTIKSTARFVDALPVNSRSAGRVGEIQCNSQHGGCQHDPTMCTLYSDKAVCGNNAVASAVKNNKALPYSVNGVDYEFSNNAVQAKLSKLGTMSLFFDADVEIVALIDEVEPVCGEQAISISGCHSCSSGFWATIKVWSANEPGQVSVAMIPQHATGEEEEEEEEPAEFGLYQSSFIITTDENSEESELMIHGFTSQPINNCTLRVTGSEGYACDVPISWSAPLQDEISESTRYNMNLTKLDTRGWDEGVGGIFGSIGSFFSSLFGGGDWWVTAVTIVAALIFVCIVGPLIGPLIVRVVNAISSIPKALSGYRRVSPK